MYCYIFAFHNNKFLPFHNMVSAINRSKKYFAHPEVYKTAQYLAYYEDTRRVLC